MKNSIEATLSQFSMQFSKRLGAIFGFLFSPISGMGLSVCSH